MDLLFYTEDNTTAALMLQLGAISVIFYCPSTLTNSVLQGLDDMMTPVKNSTIALVVHIISLFVMMVAFKWNIYAVVMSRTIFAATVYMLNSHALRERIGYVQERKRTFIIPIIAAGIMGAVAVIVHLLFELFAGARIATVFALLAAVPTYGAALVLLGGVTEDEIESMPKGALLLSICQKTHLLSYQRAKEQSEMKVAEETRTQDVTVTTPEPAPATVAADGQALKEDCYYLMEVNGYVVVYLSDKKTPYEYTDIKYDELPAEIRDEIRNGKYMEDAKTLYGFLENYSS